MLRPKVVDISLYVGPGEHLKIHNRMFGVLFRQNNEKREWSRTTFELVFRRSEFDVGLKVLCTIKVTNKG